MGFVVKPVEAIACLDELEREFLRVGVGRCKYLEDKSQLAAFLCLGIRAVSLLRRVVQLLAPDTLDSFDAVQRSFQETWQLQFEFRLVDSRSKAATWVAGQGGSWHADRKKLDGSMESLGRSCPN